MLKKQCAFTMEKFSGHYLNQGFLWWLSGKESTCSAWDAGERSRFDPWVRKIPWRRKWQPTPVLLPETSHGQRSRPWTGLPSMGSQSQMRLITQAYGEPYSLIFISWFKKSVGVLQLQRLFWEQRGPRTVGEKPPLGTIFPVNVGLVHR